MMPERLTVAETRRRLRALAYVFGTDWYAQFAWPKGQPGGEVISERVAWEDGECREVTQEANARLVASVEALSGEKR